MLNLAIIALLLPALALAQDDTGEEEEPGADTPATGSPAESQTTQTTPATDDEPEVMVITGALTAQPLSESVVATQVISQDTMREVGAGDAAEALEAESSIQVDRTFRGAAVRIQGLEPEHSLVLVDGFRIAGRRDGVLDLSRFPTELVEQIEPGVLNHYQRSVSKRGETAVVPVIDGACQGCFMKVTPETVNALKRGVDLIFCKTCSRILYLP